jgi:hypothetical protein
MVGARSILLTKLPAGEEVMLSEANNSHHEVSKSKVLEDLTVDGGLMSYILQRKRQLQNNLNGNLQQGFQQLHKAGIFLFAMSLH